MRPYRRTAALLGSALLLVTSCGGGRDEANTSAPDTTAPDTRASDLAADATRALFADIRPDDPGCSIAVRRDDDIVFAEAFGAASLDPLAPMTPDTVVDIGSTSKQFTATAILLLVDRGVVDLDASLSTYLPDLPDWAAEVTIEHMVHHTSGIPDYIGLLLDDGVSFQDVATDQMALDALGDVTRLDFAPASSWEYSNSNYFLLAQVVLAVTGDDLGAFLATEVFEPLGMQAVMDPTASIANKAESYGRQGDTWVDADSPWQQLGDGAIQTTPTELLTWASEYWQPSIGPADINEQRLADAADAGDGSRYGFGIIESFDDERRMLEHSGGWGGFVTVFVVDPDARLAVAATCTAPESVPAAIDDSADLLDLWRAEP